MTTTTMATRSFGVEIEITNKPILEMATSLRAAGINVWEYETDTVNLEDKVQEEARFLFNRKPELFASVWKVVSDGSVPRGCEVVSPILAGNEGLETLKKVVEAINASGGKAGTDCGLHVHVDARDLEPLELVSAASRYSAFEEKIDTFVHPRRRGESAQWCNGMRSVLNAMKSANFEDTPQNIFRNIDRYHKLNLLAFLRHGTVEFRQLEGTTDFNKISTWIQFCVAFVESSRLDGSVIAAELQRFREVRAGLPPELVMLFRNTSWLDHEDLGYYWGVHWLTARKKMEKYLVDFKDLFEVHSGGRHWRFNGSKYENSFNFEVGEWDKGIPAEVVSSLGEIARTQPAF
jgi:hypothetical protein